MLRNTLMLAVFSMTIFTFSGCDFMKKAGSTASKINLFPVEEDVKLGLQVSQQIESDATQFPILDKNSNPEAYRFIQNITDKILNSGTVKHKDIFKWEVKIIDDDKTLNAFCTPGGYIYVYTGLMLYLDTEDELAGVMGHEIAHADLRHSTRQMTKIHGLDMVRQIMTGKADPGLVSQIALGLVNLKFSRGHETESDTESVRYLCATDYNAAGAAGFFEKLLQESENGGTPPEFLSTHPSPDNRVENIKAQKVAQGCTGTGAYTTEYDKIKRLLKK